MVKPAGKQKFRCHACGCYGTLVSDYGYSEERKSEILRAYHERSSLRGLECIFGVVRQTVAAWLKKAHHLRPLETTLVPPNQKTFWSWTSCVVRPVQGQRLLGVGRTLPPYPTEVVPWFAGDRTRTVAASSGRYRRSLPGRFTLTATSGPTKACLGTTINRSVRKTGQTAHIERWNNTLRHRLARFVRKSLAFSKSNEFHYIVLQLFIYEYNLAHAS